MEIEGRKLLVNRIGGIHLVDRTVYLQIVVVHNHHKIIQLTEAREHSSLPDLSLFNLAVTEQRVGAVGIAVNLCRECHTDRSGNALAQGTARHIDARNVLHIRMSL